MEWVERNSVGSNKKLVPNVHGHDHQRKKENDV